MDNLIELQNATKIYKGTQDVVAMDHIDLTIKKGEFIAITGPSGSGKSTMMNIMGLLDGLTEGKLLYKGEDVSDWNLKKRAQFRNKEIGFIFQSHLLLPEFTALENVLIPSMIARTYGKNKKDYAKCLLELVGLGDKLSSTPAHLSGGQNQRVAIARALMNKPSVVFADEPTGALDQKTGEEIFKIFKKINSQENVCFIIVTHERELAEKSERIIQIIDGKVVKDETRR